MTTVNPDTAIIAAWERRNAAVADLVAVPQTPCAGPYWPGEQEILSRLDEAEAEIAANNAITTHGVMIQLWAGLYHSLTDYEGSAPWRGVRTPILGQSQG